jgi:hypothetical protein
MSVPPWLPKSPVAPRIALGSPISRDLRSELPCYVCISEVLHSCTYVHMYTVFENGYDGILAGCPSVRLCDCTFRGSDDATRRLLGFFWGNERVHGMIEG